MHKHNPIITEKILMVMTKLYEGSKLTSHQLCKSVDLHQRYGYSLIRLLKEENLLHGNEWNKQFAQPNMMMAERFHKMCTKYMTQHKQKVELSDEQLVTMLRERGYTVVATKEVTNVISL